MKLNRFGAKSSYREMLLVQHVAIGPSQVNLDRHKIDRTFRVVNSVVKNPLIEPRNLSNRH